MDLKTKCWKCTQPKQINEANQTCLRERMPIRVYEYEWTIRRCVREWACGVCTINVVVSSAIRYTVMKLYQFIFMELGSVVIEIESEILLRLSWFFVFGCNCNKIHTHTRALIDGWKQLSLKFHWAALWQFRFFSLFSFFSCHTRWVQFVFSGWLTACTCVFKYFCFFSSANKTTTYQIFISRARAIIITFHNYWLMWCTYNI